MDKTKITKSSLKIIAWFFGVIFAVFLSLVIALQISNFRLWLVTKELPKLAKNSGYEIDFISPKTASLQEWSFDKISVSQDNQTVFLAKNLQLKYNLFAILTGKTIINNFTADEITINPPKPSNQPSSSANNNSGQPKLTAFAVENFEVKELILNSNSANPAKIYLKGDINFLTKKFPLVVNLKITNLDRKLPISAEIISQETADNVAISGFANFYNSKININGNLGSNKSDVEFNAQNLDLSPIAKILKQNISGAINAKINIHLENNHLVVKAKANFDLANLKSFLPSKNDKISGEFSTEIVVDGDIKKPKELTNNLKITAGIKKGYYQNEQSGFILNALQAAFLVDGQKIKITNFAANDGNSGKFNLTGEVDLKNKKLSNQLKFNNYQIVKRQEVNGKASGNIDFNGTFFEPTITGKIDLGPTLVMLDKINFPNKNKATPPAPKATKQNSKAKSKLKAKLDIEVAAKDGNQIKGRGLDAYFEGKIKLYGDSQNPKYNGSFYITKGFYQFLDTKFNVTQGKINFDDSKNFNLAVSTNHKQNNVEIIAEIIASNYGFKTNLKSNPKMSFGEIVSYVIFGKPSPELNILQGIRFAKIMLDLKKDGTIDGLLP